MTGERTERRPRWRPAAGAALACAAVLVLTSAIPPGSSVSPTPAADASASPAATPARATPAVAPVASLPTAAPARGNRTASTPPPGSGPAPRQPLWAAADPRQVSMDVLTRDADDVYTVAPTAAGLRVQADAANVGSDSRVLLHRPSTPPVLDGESCASWGDRAGDIVQQGAALRITHEGEAVQAITVTQNIYVSPYTFNIHTWDTSRPGLPWSLEGQFDMRERFFAFGHVSFPWRFCARAVGDRVEFKVWSRHEREPGWGDPAHSDGMTLPPGWERPGHVGWYVGHLRAGDHADVDGPSAWAYRWQQSMVPRVRPG